MNQLLSLFAIAAQIAIVVLVISILLYRKKTDAPNILLWIAARAVKIAFILIVLSIAGSMFYSEIAGFEPCKLCWYQRIFLFPQAFILGLALYKKETKSVGDYAILLSVFGGAIALYHNYLQFGGSPLIPCSAAASCVQRFVYEYGYITIPMMSLTIFTLIIALFFAEKRFRKN